jgi:hypothetical protein
LCLSEGVRQAPDGLSNHIRTTEEVRLSIKITHTRREGTLIDGTRRGDGAAEILKARHYPSGYTQPARWSRTLSCWYLPRSRDKATSKAMLEALAERLRQAGFTVTVTIDETDRRTFAEAEAERAERAADRAERYDGYADNAADRSDAAWRRGRQIADGIPPGQPILVGHHSEGRARRDLRRMDDAMRTSVREGERAAHWSGRAAAAGGYEAFRKNPGRTLRRIEKLRADLRAVEKWQRGESAKGYRQDIGNPETASELKIRHEELTEEISYWEGVIQQAEAEGFKVWSKADFRKGDFALSRGRWFEVLRVNAQSVTIPHIHNGIGRKVVRASDSHLDWTWRLPYNEISGRRSAEEMAAPDEAATAA